MSILIGIFTFVLILLSVFLILVVLAQKAQTDGGMGATLGGGATEAAFGADTGNVLTKATINSAILFFVLTFGLYLAHIYVSNHHTSTEGQLPVIEAPVAPETPATPDDASMTIPPAGEATQVETPSSMETPAVENTEAPVEEPAAVTLPPATPAAPAEEAQP